MNGKVEIYFKEIKKKITPAMPEAECPHGECRIQMGMHCAAEFMTNLSLTSWSRVQAHNRSGCATEVLGVFDGISLIVAYSLGSIHQLLEPDPTN